MASTYSSNIGIELITEGEQAGAWGTTTNNNWSKAEEATSSYSTVTVTDVAFDWTLSDTVDAYTPSTASTTGSTGRALFVEFVSEGSGDPGTAPTVSIRGNGTGDYPSRIFFAKNSLSNSHDLTLQCGSGDSLVLKNGCVAAVYTVPSGTAGAAANVFSNLQVGGIVLEQNGVIVFETTDDDAFETTLIAADAGASDRVLTLPAATDQLVGRLTLDTLTNKTLTSPVLTTPQINDSASNHQYVFASADLAADRTVSLPLLGSADTFVFQAHAQTLTSKTLTAPVLTSPVINTAISGSAFLTSTDMAENSATKVASQQSIKAYVDAQVTAQDLDIQGDSGTGAVDLDSQSLDIAGGSGITTAASGQTATVNIDAAQTTITSVLNAGLKVGRDADNDISFASDNTILLKANGTAQIQLSDGVLKPITTNDIDLGASDREFKDAWFDGTVTSDAFAGPLTGNVTGDCSGSAATVTAGTQGSITAASNLVTVGALNAGSITSGFTSINTGSGAITTTGTLTGGAIVGTSLNLGDGNIREVGDINCDSISADAAALGLDVQFDGNTTTNKITLTDNLADALNITEASNSYVKFITTNGSEQIVFGKNSTFSGTTIANLGIVSASSSITSNEFHGPITGNVTGNATTATELATGRTIGMTGDVVWTSASFDGSGNVTGTAAIQANSVALGTDTTGSYVQQGATSGNGISGSVNSQGGTFTVTSNAVSAATGSTLVFRDGSGDFSAGTITAALTGNCSGSAATATTATNATNVATSVGTDTTSSVCFFDGTTGDQAARTHAGLTFNAGGIPALAVTGLISSTVSMSSNVIAASGSFSGPIYTSSGATAVTSASNGDITLTPNGTGAVVTTGLFNMNGASTSSETASGASVGTSVLIGKSAGAAISAGAGGNVCIGDSAGGKLSSGHSNVFIGADAGGETTTHATNVGIGRYACGGAGTGVHTNQKNTATGYSSLAGVEGEGNSGYGSYAGDSITTGQHNTMIGSSSDASAVDVDYEIAIGASCVGQGTNTCTIGKAGSDSITINYTTQTGWSDVSDAGLKKNISDSSLGLAFINAIRPVTFNFKQREDLDGSEPDEISAMIDPRDGEDNPLPGKTTELISGFIAQEVKAALDASGTASVANSGWSQSPTGVERLASGQFVMPLVKAVQELSAQVAGLEARLAVLE